ncbi:Cyclic nucleotide-binding helix-turn-helix transcriptional activator, Crp family [uncultured Alphaproteobacteria bacterium]|uniref:Cyclic nucleotide-binding helix-turn-helix transcriptional activator, Crp family n=1 Tax=uncultured Alphaproteobacteria bacterium TaxID=91750 RepID=A0A212K2X7_9PROT|nr:Cyclic nucleotide-binding helix-turn-helix transcriptional activator, Crp family [uncultured Alphaproteobacteria bacterium]
MSHCFSLFDVLENPEHDEFFRSFTSRKIREREIVCDANSSENNVFVVLAGELRVYVSYEGREFTLFFLGPGDVFSTHSRMIVEAKKPGEILSTSLDNFKQALVRIPCLSISVIASLCQGLGNAVHVIEGLVFRDVKHRLIRFLVDVAADKGHAVEGGIVVNHDFSTEDIATIIGSTRQSTSLILNKLIKDGYLTRLSRRHLLIRDIDALKAAAEKEDEMPETWKPRAGGHP